MQRSAGYLKFPFFRARRIRKSNWIRNLVSETQISINDLVQPIFITDEKFKDKTISSISDIKRFSLKNISKEVEELCKLGINAVALFPVINKSQRSLEATEATNPDNIICKCLRLLRKEFPDIGIICDIALDPFTSSGHDGILNKFGEVDNDKTIKILSQMSINYVKSGCEIIAPSDMMDGRIKNIRKNLEDQKYTDTIIMSYAAKFSSQFYGPFREIIGNNKKIINKNSYQLNSKNRIEAVKDALADISEGADILMVKPAGYYLDIVRDLKELCFLPIAAYQVSSEYFMIKNGAKENFFNYEETVLESLSCIKRAGADIIFSYFSKDVAKWL